MRDGLLITDIENTVFDWVGTWSRALERMVAVLEAETGRARSRWLELLRHVYARRQALECSCALDDLVRDSGWTPSVDQAAAFTHAAAAYRLTWDTHLAPYDGLRHTLISLVEYGWRIVAYTESDARIAAARLARMGLAGVITGVFGRAPSAPSSKCGWSLIEIPPRVPITLDLIPRADLKPNPCGLRDIAARCGTSLDRIVYVGDDLSKDVAMARALGVRAIWAAYGAKRRPEETALVDAVSYWPPAKVGDPRPAPRESIQPDAIVRVPSELVDAVALAPAAT